MSRKSAAAEVPASQQPGNSFKYLYERLGEKPFQQLCNALLAAAFPDIACYPVGQSDAGRDAVRKVNDRSLIYQVKWTKTRLKSRAAWLNAAIKSEAENAG